MTTPRAGDDAGSAGAVPREPARRFADQRDRLVEWVFAERAAREAAEADAHRRTAELEWIRRGRAFRLAQALSAARSWRGLQALPAELLGLLQQPRPSALDNAAPARPAPCRRIGRVAVARPLRIVAVVDRLTEAGLAGECDLLLPSPDTEPAMISDFKPDFLFVESAWAGNDGAWRDALHDRSVALLQLLRTCWAAGVATVFWNKEDPIHFEHFAPIARLFDYVYTTDGGSRCRYRDAMGVVAGVLPFACNPRLQAPVRESERLEAAVFAGSYYLQYPDRCRDFEQLVDAVATEVPVDIFDRNHGSGRADFAFPSRFDALLRGSLDPAAAAGLGGRYRYVLNVNTVTDSPTMLSRRVVESMAAGSIIVSTPSRAMSRMAGELVITGTARGVAERVGALQADPVQRRRLALLGRRRALDGHTWRHRLAQLERDVLGRTPSPDDAVAVVAPVATSDDVATVLAAYDRQRWPRRHLVLVAMAPRMQPPSRGDVVLLEPEDDLPLDPTVHAAGFHPGDHYGPGYLEDLVLATRQWPEAALGKHARYDASGRLLHAGAQFAAVDTLGVRRVLLCGGRGAIPLSARALAASIAANAQAVADSARAVDEFNYSEGLAPAPADAADGADAIDAGLDADAFALSVDHGDSTIS